MGLAAAYLDLGVFSERISKLHQTQWKTHGDFGVTTPSLSTDTGFEYLSGLPNMACCRKQ